MGKPAAETTQNAITQQSLDIQKQTLEQSNQDRAQRQQLEQPAIDQYTALTTGSPQKALEAAAPFLSQISSGYTGAKSQITENIAPGAARDLALAQLETQKGSSIGNTLASSVQAAFDKLANLGAGIGSFSLQELGAGLSAGQTASSSNQSVMQAEQQQKASQLGFLGSLAGTAGSFFPTFGKK